MELKDLYREIVNDHNINPMHKFEMEDPDIVLRGVNPSCGDDISLMLRVKDGVIMDASYTGCGCAISQASVDMMIDNVIGLTKEEALYRIELFLGMIEGTVTDEKKLEALDEAMYLSAISHMPARVKCAVLGWRTLKKILTESDVRED
ncbi:MAG: SUF system NifU family Fe-S cluster assembly protein [Saccharofermentans sp.]|nr:SUF system NifU family Fe-S cluster assembly protein [Saccharofermentans sp.]